MNKVAGSSLSVYESPAFGELWEMKVRNKRNSVESYLSGLLMVVSAVGLIAGRNIRKELKNFNPIPNSFFCRKLRLIKGAVGLGDLIFSVGVTFSGACLGKEIYDFQQYSKIFVKSDTVWNQEVALLLQAPDTVFLENKIDIGNSLKKSGLHVITKEVTCAKDINEFIDQIKKQKNKIRVVVLNAHGSGSGINLTKGYILEGKCLSSLRHLEAGAKVILQSCSTGKEGGEKTIAAKIRDEIPVRNVEVIAPTEDTYPNNEFFFKSLYIRGKGASLQVEFRRFPLTLEFWTRGADYTAKYSTSSPDFPNSPLVLLRTIRKINPIFSLIKAPFGFPSLFPNSKILITASSGFYSSSIKGLFNPSKVRTPV